MVEKIHYTDAGLSEDCLACSAIRTVRDFGRRFPKQQQTVHKGCPALDKEELWPGNCGGSL